MDIFTFMADNPWQTFFLGPFVLVLITLFLSGLGQVLEFVYRTIVRLLRTLNVCVRGWPPEHLDADGDFKLKRNIKIDVNN